MKSENNWVKIALWVVGGFVFVILTPELRDLVLFIMLGMLLSRVKSNKLF